jgi:hypothetical protein
MTSVPTITATTSLSRTSSRPRAVQDLRQRLRLRLKPKAPTTGWVDGGWWPRSQDLAAELPGLLAVLAVRLGHVERVSYHLGDWGPTPHKIRCDSGVVRLEGYHSQHTNTVDVLAEHQRVTLLVVRPEASAQTAHAALMAAGHRGNTDDVDTLLRSPRRVAEVLDGAGSQREAALQSWEVDGGRILAVVQRPARSGPTRASTSRASHRNRRRGV